MALKRKSPSPPPPPPPQEHSSYEDTSSEEEEEMVAPAISSQAKTPQGTKAHQEESESEYESDSDPDPPARSSKVLFHKRSESEEDSDEEDHEEEEEEPPKVEKPMAPTKSPIKKPESEPEKKKVKISDDQSLSKKSSPAFIARIWSQEDELALLHALAQYHDENGKLPPAKDYGPFLAKISGSIGFPVTEKQIFNKIRVMRDNYSKKKKKGSDLKITKPHEKAVFDISSKLFEENSKPSKKGAKVAKVEGNSSTDSENEAVADFAYGGVANGGVIHSGAANGGYGARSNQYLRSLIEDLVKERQLPNWLSIEDMVSRVGKLSMNNLEARIKLYRIDAMKLRAREESLKAELFATIAEGMELH